MKTIKALALAAFTAAVASSCTVNVEDPVPSTSTESTTTTSTTYDPVYGSSTTRKTTTTAF